MKSKRVAILASQPTNAALYPTRYLMQGFRDLGWDAAVFARSEDLANYGPEFVLALGHRQPKLTEWPTYGVLADHWQAYQDARCVRNILSYDAYFTGVERVREWLMDITFGARKRGCPVGFLPPTRPATRWTRRTAPMASLAHVQDGEVPAATAKMLACLAERPFFRLFSLDEALHRGDNGGPPASVFDSHGAGLYLQDPAVCGDGVVSSRFFEMVAAGALVICFRNTFVERRFGSNVLYLDADAPPQILAWQVEKHMKWIADHPQAARKLARQAHKIFVQQMALETLLPAVLEIHEAVCREKGYPTQPVASGDAGRPSVAYILRTEGQPQRALESLRRQQYGPMHVLLVPHEPASDLQEIADEFSDLNIQILDDVEGNRCSALWRALRQVRESGFELFGVLEDDDELFPNHVRTLLDTLEYHSGRSWFGRIGVAYSGCVERAASKFASDRFVLPDDRPVPRKLRIRQFRFYHPYLLDSLAHACHGASFLASAELLDDEILTDPELGEGEVAYLQLLLAEKTVFAFSCEVTSVVHNQDESEPHKRPEQPLEGDQRRVFFRTLGRSFPASSMYLHNIIFTTRFDHDLMAPVICANSPEKRPPVPLRSPQALGGAKWAGRVLKIPNRRGSGASIPNLRLPVGGYRLSCFVHLRQPVDPARPILSLELVNAPGVAPVVLSAGQLSVLGDARAASLEFTITRQEAGDRMEFRLLSLAGGAFDILGTELLRTGAVSSCSLQDLNPTRPVWLYGAGEGGRIMKRKLDIIGLNATGFVDKHKKGTMEGLPIIDLETASQVIDEGCNLLIASQFWQEIREDLTQTGISTNLYSAFPYQGNTIHEIF